MIIIDKALENRHKEGNPIRIGLVGAGFMGRGITLQIEKYVRGMELVAISNRTITKAKDSYQEAGVDVIKAVETVTQWKNLL